MRWVLVPTLAAAAAGCGDNLCRDPAPTGAFARAGALPEPVGCVAGAVGRAAAAGDLDGRWHVVVDSGSPFTFSNPVLVTDAACANLELPGWAEGAVNRFTSRDDDQLFWRAEFYDADREEGQRMIQATRACATADGSFAVRYGLCDWDGSCDSWDGRMERFGRLAGEAVGDGLILVGESAGTGPRLVSLNVRVRDGFAYLAQRGALRIFDVRDPGRPRQVGIYDDPDYYRSPNFNDVKIVAAGARRYAVLAGERTPIVDVTDPAAPVLAAQLDTYSHSVFVGEQGGRPRLYLANYGLNVPVYDVTDPAAPALVGNALGPDDLRVHDLYADEGLLYLNGTESGFVVLDARESIGQARIIGQVPSLYSHASWVGTVGGRRIAIHGDEGHTAHLRVFDADPDSPTFLAELSSWRTREQVSIHNMMLVGDLAFIAYYQDGVRVVDLSDPTQPRQVAYYNTWDPERGDPGPFAGALGIDVVGDLIYVADDERGLIILRRTGG